MNDPLPVFALPPTITQYQNALRLQLAGETQANMITEAIKFMTAYLWAEVKLNRRDSLLRELRAYFSNSSLTDPNAAYFAKAIADMYSSEVYDPTAPTYMRDIV